MTATTPGPAERAVRDQQMRRIVDDLVRDYGDRFPRDEVGSVYRDSYDRLIAKARVQTFLPVLAGRFAGERLDARARASDMRAHRTPGVLAATPGVFICRDCARSAAVHGRRRR